MRVCVSAHTHVGLVPMGEKTPQAPLTCNPSHFPAETALLPAPLLPPPISPQWGEALKLALKGSTYIPNLQAT